MNRTKTTSLAVLPSLGALSLAAVVVAAGPAAASAGSAYGQWSLSGQSGTLTLPAAGFPEAAVHTDGTAPQVGTGASAYLNQHTPFGRVYGSSRNHPYLLIRTHGNSPSTTHVNFQRPTPPGWGFALGDVDADNVQVHATGVSGRPLTVAELGWQEAFNFCVAGAPRPSTCTPGSTDVPQWDPATATLIGNGPDTAGASGWFRPTVPVRSLTFTFTRQSGSPIFQLWAATEETTVSGHVQNDCPHQGPSELALYQHGAPVLDAHGHPLTTSVTGSGDYSFPRLAPGDYEVRIAPEPGDFASPDSHAADTSAGDDRTGNDFQVGCPVPVTSPPFTFPPSDVSFPILIRDVGFDPHQPVVVDEKPHGGTVHIHSGKLVYHPDPHFSGTDRFTVGGISPAGRAMRVTITVKVPKHRVHAAGHGHDHGHHDADHGHHSSDALTPTGLAPTGLDPAPVLGTAAGLGAAGALFLGLGRAVRRRRT